MAYNLLNNYFFRFPRRTRWAIIVAVVTVGLGVFSYRLLATQPTVIDPSGPALGAAHVSNTKPVVIIFSGPVRTKTLTHEITPELQGSWEFGLSPWPIRSTLTFIPAESPDLDTRYTISLGGIRGLLGRHSSNYLLSFQTDTSPVLVSVSPPGAAVDVLPDAPIVVTLDKALNDAAEFSVTIAPEIALDNPKADDKTLIFNHATPFQKNTGYVIQVTRSTSKLTYATGVRTTGQDPTVVMTSAFTTVAAPGIAAQAPTGSSIDPATTVIIEFQQVMDKESTQAAFSIDPTVAGAFTWETEQKMVFTPSPPLAKNQLYTVTLANTAKAANGVTLDAGLTFTFTTIGAVTVASFAPGNGAKNSDPATTVSLTFNQAVTHPSAESKFSITPSAVGSFTWSGKTMAFHPAATLAFNTSYTATIAAGVQSVRGLDSTSAFSTKFTTRNQSVMLDIPSYRQAHMYSCMIAAARSALAFRGVNVSEASIIAKTGFDPTKWSGTWGGSNGVWGDPDVAMVGPLDNAAATQPAGKTTTNVYWGYGSHWGPIAKAMTSFGVANEVRSGMTVQDLAASISAGNPVIVWWVNGIWPAYEVRWKTPSGKSVRGVNGLHVQVVRGFTGSVDNPVSFTVTDSGYGYPGRTLDIGTFKARWEWFGNTGIIVK